MTQPFVQIQALLAAFPYEAFSLIFLIIILFWVQPFVFHGSIVVSLPCTTYHFETCPRYRLKKNGAGILSSAILKSLCCCCLTAICTISITAQDTAQQVKQQTASIKSIGRATHSHSILLSTKPGRKDTAILKKVIKPGFVISPRFADGALTSHQVKSRVRFVAISNVVGYSTILAGLYSDWYANYPHSGFHFFNDNKEWLQVDKAGHLYSSYIESRTSMELWRWTGIDRKRRIWLGGMSGTVYQTVIEILDGFSKEWGWSWGDFSANTLGSAILISQELAWDDQRIKIKFSFHKNNYADPQLSTRADKIFGQTLTERLIKDYNAQTYWASANLRAFFPKTNLPPWLALAVGYGAQGMYGARDNTAKDEDGIINFDRRDIKRYRQFYLSPDIDFTKIKTKKKSLRVLFTVLSAFKFPAPSLEFSNGKFKVNALHF